MPVFWFGGSGFLLLWIWLTSSAHSNHKDVSPASASQKSWVYGCKPVSAKASCCSGCSAVLGLLKPFWMFQDNFWIFLAYVYVAFVGRGENDCFGRFQWPHKERSQTWVWGCRTLFHGLCPVFPHSKDGCGKDQTNATHQHPLTAFASMACRPLYQVPVYSWDVMKHSDFVDELQPEGHCGLTLARWSPHAVPFLSQNCPLAKPWKLKTG